MNTPASVKQQQKHMKKTSGKKGPVKGLRNVLAQPFDTDWPVLAKEAGCHLEQLLTGLLPELRRSPSFVPWSHLRKLDKEERRAARETLRRDDDKVKKNDNVRKSVTLGVNSITRDLEKERVYSILLDSGVESLLIRHVISMAQWKNIPILLVPFLKKVTLSGIGFASAAIGLKREATESGHSLHEVHEEIVKLAQTVLPTEHNISSLEVLSSSPVAEDVEMSVQEDSPKPRLSVSTDIYKYRSVREERTFVPPHPTNDTSKCREEWGDFIALGKGDDMKLATPKFLIPRGKRLAKVGAILDDERTRESVESVSSEDDKELQDNKSKKRRRNNATYLPLKVKRIQGNNNRIKATKAIKRNKKSSVNKK